MNAIDFNQFLAWEATTRDTIDFKTIYVDMTGDLIAGLLLSQIVYWHLPNRDGVSKLRVKKDGKAWIAKKRTDWWGEIRITAYQYDRASQILKDKGLVEIELYKFNGSPTHHIRLNRETFLAVFRQNLKSISNCDENPIEDESNNITETTAENTSQTTTEESPPPTVTQISELPPTENPLSVSNSLPIQEEAQGPPERLDYIEAVSQHAKRAKPSWTIPAEAGGLDGFADGPLTAFCDLVGTRADLLTEKERKRWANKLRSIAAPRDINPQELAHCIALLPESDWGWRTKSFTSPHAGGFDEVVIALINRIRADRPIITKSSSVTPRASEPAGFAGIRDWLAEVQHQAISNNNPAGRQK